MNKDSEKTGQYKANRAALIQLSAGLRILLKEGAIDSVNEGLKEIYMDSDPEIDEFRTFGQWKADGYMVKKGAKAFLIWGQPRTASQVPEGATEPEEYNYWPICYLFANTQVIKPSRDRQSEPQPEAVPAAMATQFDESMI